MSYGVFNIPPPPQPPTYKLFITHAWDHQEYDALIDLIRPDATFRWENLSVPKENPIAMLIGLPKSIRKLVHELDDRIRQADCVLIITGMYVAHRQWIQSEIEAALDFRKSIVGIAPRGQERIPEVARVAIEQANGAQVRWNRDSIISAIRRRAGVEPPISLADFVRRPALPASRPASLLDFVGKPTDPPPSPGNSTLSDLLQDITKNWPKKQRSTEHARLSLRGERVNRVGQGGRTTAPTYPPEIWSRRFRARGEKGFRDNYRMATWYSFRTAAPG